MKTPPFSCLKRSKFKRQKNRYRSHGLFLSEGVPAPVSSAIWSQHLTGGDRFSRYNGVIGVVELSFLRIDGGMLNGGVAAYELIVPPPKNRWWIAV
jgi:hypothetical protein